MPSVGVHEKAWPAASPAMLLSPAPQGPESGATGREMAVPMALVENLVTRIQEIPFSGSDGDVLRLVFGMHEVFQPGPHEKNGNGAGGPRVATFVMAQAEPTPQGPGQAPAKPTEPGTLIGPDGKEYVSA